MNAEMKLFRFLIVLSCYLLFSCNNNQQAGKVDNLIKDSLPAREIANPFSAIDRSPMDMSYYPPDYPLLKMDCRDSGLLVARVIYSRPQRNGRAIFFDTEKKLC